MQRVGDYPRAVTTNLAGGEGLFELPPEERKPISRVVLVTGPSGSGKTRFTRLSGLPTISLDDFYLEGDNPDLPRRHGMVDWDSPDCWSREEAMKALIELATRGEAEIPVYDIPTNSRIGTRQVSVEGSPLFLAEGIFAAEIVDACRREGIFADALCITRPRLQTFWFRLMRDLDEGRKPPLNLLRRGVSLAISEPEMYAKLMSKGCRPVRISQAEEAVRTLRGYLQQ